MPTSHPNRRTAVRLSARLFVLAVATSLTAAAVLRAADSKEPAAAAPAAAPASKPSTQPAIHWEKWTDDLFDRAKRENKLVYLDLEAVWCHWCHVMDEITFQDPDVVRLMSGGYIAVKGDQDSRPDLSNPDENYGWPAPPIFDSGGEGLGQTPGDNPPGAQGPERQAVLDHP